MKEKNRKYETEEQQEIKKFIFVLLGIIIIIVGIYFLTRAFVTKDLFKNTDISLNYETGVIDYDIAIVGNMLSKSQSEYYVMLFGSEETEAIYYNALVTKYMNEKKEKALKVYYVDLENHLNKKYIATNEEEKSTSFTSIHELKLGSLTLVKVKNGKVSKFLTTEETIKKEFGI